MAEKTVNTGKVPARFEGAQTPATRERSRYLVPAVDIYETSEGLTVVADVPGVSKDDLQINVEDNVLTIQGRITRARHENLVTEEFELLDYFRQFTLGDKVDQSRIEASLEKGVLTLKLPKAEHAMPKRIKIQQA